MRRDLDREEKPVYTIIVKASSNRSWTPVRAQRASWARALDPGRDPTLQEVNIYLEDINDQSPRFVKKEYTAGKGTEGNRASQLGLLSVLSASGWNATGWCLVKG